MTAAPGITTHVLDTSLGRPAVGVFVVLEHYVDTERNWHTIAEGKSDAKGRVDDLLPAKSLEEGLYRITFDTDAYFGDREVETFYPSISVNFQVADPKQHHHVPLLLSPYGYTTYRGG